jgi:NAD(P)-dependent dehydrogenase (short-subunit alcohol dehydrogenase family)
MSDLFDLTDRVVVVTGGLGQLGRQFSLALLDYGARVAVVSRQIPPRSALRDRFPIDNDRLDFFQADVTSREQLQAALQQITERWAIPQVLINNAGIDAQPNAPAEENGPFEQYPESIWDRVIDVNLKGVFLCCQIIGGAMADAGSGSVINIGSIYGILSPIQEIYAYRAERDGKPFIKPVAYAASKSGLLNLTRYLATYWAPKGVRVNTLTLAGVHRATQDEQFIQNYTSRIPIGRMANENEYNGAIVFLASDASRYMTGSNLVIDGGWSAW